MSSTAIQTGLQNEGMLEAIELITDLDLLAADYDEDCYEIGLDHGWTYGGPFGAEKTYRWDALIAALQQLSADRVEQGLRHLDALIKGCQDGRCDCDNVYRMEAQAGMA